nr:MAG TPA: hypothetical protein [Caudoviricetes sp.]
MNYSVILLNSQYHKIKKLKIFYYKKMAHLAGLFINNPFLNKY